MTAANVVRRHAHPHPGLAQRRRLVAHDVLDRVDDRIVAEVRPAVVHVEQRDVHRLIVDGRQLAAALDAREREDGILARRGATKQAGILPVGGAKLTVEGHQDVSGMTDDD